MSSKAGSRTRGNVRMWAVLITTALVVAGGFAYTLFKINSLNDHIAILTKDLASTSVALYGTTGALSKDVSNLNTQASDIAQTLTSTRQDIVAASTTLQEVQNKVGGVEQAVGSISGTVSTLQKLAVTDPELLMKYSKVYFLNENYRPAHLTAIPQDYVYSNSVPESFVSESMPFLVRLLAAAKADGVTLYVDSGYRSFAEQQQLKSSYTVQYGAGTANSFSADQGYSEHQLGTTVDFLTSGLGGQLTPRFDTTKAFQWLSQNAHKYGFEMSYPKGNGYYVYEPWHWRFVGVRLATHLHEQGKRFYDLDQRTIDSYLAGLFDE